MRFAKSLGSAARKQLALSRRRHGADGTRATKSRRMDADTMAVTHAKTRAGQRAKRGAASRTTGDAGMTTKPVEKLVRSIRRLVKGK